MKRTTRSSPIAKTNEKDTDAKECRAANASNDHAAPALYTLNHHLFTTLLPSTGTSPDTRKRCSWSIYRDLEDSDKGGGPIPRLHVTSAQFEPNLNILGHAGFGSVDSGGSSCSDAVAPPQRSTDQRVRSDESTLSPGTDECTNS